MTFVEARSLEADCIKHGGDTAATSPLLFECVEYFGPKTDTSVSGGR